MGRTRIPDNVKGFDAYMRTTGAHLFKIDTDTGQAGWQRLGLTLAEANLWLSKCNFWNNILYPKYCDLSRRTITLTATAKQFRKDFSNTCNPTVRRIATSVNATASDEVVFNFSRAINTGRRRVAAIKEQCVTKVIRLGSCMFLIKCSTLHNGRAKKAKGADSILMHYKIVKREMLTGKDHLVNDTWKQKVLPNARQVFNADTANKGDILLCAFQWNYKRKGWLAGPLGEVQSFIIA
jgi:hypothetical protein